MKYHELSSLLLDVEAACARIEVDGAHQKWRSTFGHLDLCRGQSLRLMYRKRDNGLLLQHLLCQRPSSAGNLPEILARNFVFFFVTKIVGRLTIPRI